MEQPDSEEQLCAHQHSTFSCSSLSSPPISLLSTLSHLPQRTTKTNYFTTLTRTSLSYPSRSHLSSVRSLSHRESLPRWKKSFLAMKASIFQDPTLQTSSNSFSTITSSHQARTQKVGSLKWWLLQAIPVRNLWTFCLSI